MAHEVETMAFFGSTPWHGLGTPLGESDCYDWPGAARKGGLDWTVDLVTLQTTDTGVAVGRRGRPRCGSRQAGGCTRPRR